jgi:hypothetical protein
MGRPGQTIFSLSSAQIDRAEIHRTTGAGLKLKQFEAPHTQKKNFPEISPTRFPFPFFEVNSVHTVMATRSE